jgi:hypothetical protein
VGKWRPSALTDIQRLLSEEFALLDGEHQRKLQELLISPFQVPVLDCPGETVYVVGKRGEFVLYWSDVEEGWEWEELGKNGGLASRGCNQFKLNHITHQLFGEPR